MTKQELNRDIKRLWKQFKNRERGDTRNWTPQDWSKYENQQAELKVELSRLWRADYEKTYTNLNNLKRLLIMNEALRVIQLHNLTYRMKVE